MRKPARYWTRRFSDGSLAALVRVRESDEGLWTEFFSEGRWHEDPSGVSYLMDPLLGDEVTPEAARTVVEELGHEWPGEPPP